MILSPIIDRSRWFKPRISQWFGENKEFYEKYGSTNGHSGIDFAVPVGTSVLAPFDGIVKIEKNHPNYGYNIRLKNDRLECVLAHLSDFKAKDKAAVFMGDEIALTGGAKGMVGAGNSSGPHLHFAVRHICPDGKPMFPENGNFGYEDLSKYIICWFRTLK